VFLGDDLLQWLLLALGAAMVVGNVAALLRPPPAPAAGNLARAPRVRSVVMIAIGLAAAVPALATLTSR
jgi:xanthosine utilization system XapX-like protein